MRIALLDDYQGIARSSADWSRLPPGSELEIFHRALGDEIACEKALGNFDVVMALRERTPFPASLLERLPRLKLLASVGPRNAAIDVEAATRLGIVVNHTQGGPYSTGELTWGLILALARHIPHEHSALRKGHWQTTVGIEMNGRTMGIIGLGHIGAHMARLALAFRMRVMAWSQNLTSARAQECGAELVSLEQLLRESDVITIHTRLSARTRGLLGASQLALMKPTALLVNTSRGPIVDEAALIETLKANRIAGAALDVYDQEPMAAEHPLLKLKNVVMTPHLGYVTEEVYRNFYGQTLENILAWSSGKLGRVLNPEVWERRRQ